MNSKILSKVILLIGLILFSPLGSTIYKANASSKRFDKLLLNLESYEALKAKYKSHYDLWCERNNYIKVLDYIEALQKRFPDEANIKAKDVDYYAKCIQECHDEGAQTRCFDLKRISKQARYLQMKLDIECVNCKTYEDYHTNYKEFNQSYFITTSELEEILSIRRYIYYLEQSGHILNDATKKNIRVYGENALICKLEKKYTRDCEECKELKKSSDAVRRKMTLPPFRFQPSLSKEDLILPFQERDLNFVSDAKEKRPGLLSLEQFVALVYSKYRFKNQEHVDLIDSYLLAVEACSETSDNSPRVDHPCTDATRLISDIQKLRR